MRWSSLCDGRARTRCIQPGVANELYAGRGIFLDLNAMLLLLTLTALTGSSSSEAIGRPAAVKALESALQELDSARMEGSSGRATLEQGLQSAIRALGPASEMATELERLARGVRFEAALAGDDGASWLASQLPQLISDLRFQPVREAGLPVGFPEWTPVGEIQIQRYPAYRMARTSMRNDGSNGAFWRLFEHIQSNEIAMTAPVETTYAVEGKRVAQSSMAFLYGSRQLGQMARDGAVEVVDMPEQTVVSTGLRGYESRERITAAIQKLEGWLEANPAWTAAGPPRSMGHNSPRVLDDRRYFEVQIPVKRADMIVIDFRAADEASRWRAVDDVVMGGRSSSRMMATAEGTSAFTGELSLENNGGFASVRRDADQLHLTGATSVTLRVRGDGKSYRLRFRTDGGFDVPSYQADFQTVVGEWTEVSLKAEDFQLKWRGRRVPNAPALHFSAVRGVGLLISDKQQGPFRLELEWLSAL